MPYSLSSSPQSEYINEISQITVSDFELHSQLSVYATGCACIALASVIRDTMSIQTLSKRRYTQLYTHTEVDMG